MNATERLGRLKYRRTLYELAIGRGAEKYLVAYCGGRARNSLFRAVTSEKRVKAIVALTGRDAVTFGEQAADGATMGEWTIRFTGRTQREAITEGELPYVAAAETEARKA